MTAGRAMSPSSPVYHADAAGLWGPVRVAGRASSIVGQGVPLRSRTSCGCSTCPAESDRPNLAKDVAKIVLARLGIGASLHGTNCSPGDRAGRWAAGHQFALQQPLAWPLLRAGRQGLASCWARALNTSSSRPAHDRLHPHRAGPGGPLPAGDTVRSAGVAVACRSTPST